MRKLLICGAIATSLFAGACNEAAIWIQQRIERDIDATFADLKSTFGTATHGRIQFDLASRTLGIADIVVQSSTAPQTTLKIGHIRATGISLSGGRARADRVEISDWELSGTFAMPLAPRIAQKAPSITAEGFSIPLPLQRKLTASSAVDMMRLAMEQFAEIGATSILIPTLSAAIVPATSDGPAAAFGAAEYTYSGIALRDVSDGRVGRMTVGRFAMTVGGPVKMSAEIEGMSAIDFDSRPFLTIFDPAKAKDDGYLRVYREVSVGAYSIKMDNGGSLRIAGVSLADMGIKPSKFAFMEIFAIAQAAGPAGQPPSPDQMRVLLDRIGDFYEGIRFGKFEIRGIEIDVPSSNRVKFGAIRINGFENGKLAEFALEGMEARTPQNEPVSLGRFALKGLDIANLLRKAGKLSTTGQPPNPDQIADLFTVLEGIELNDLVAPDNRTGQMVRIETIAASWGQFIGSVPSASRWTAKATVPIGKDEKGPMTVLAESGLRALQLNIDVASAWTEGTRTFALGPARIDVGNLFAASAKVTVNNVPRDVFAVDPLQVALAAATIEAGPVEFTLRDLGILKVATAQFAKSERLSLEAGRAKLIEDIRRETRAQLALMPELKPVVDAVVRCIEAPGTTFTLRLVPKGRISLLSLAEAAQKDPATLLQRFTIEVSAGQ